MGEYPVFGKTPQIYTNSLIRSQILGRGPASNKLGSKSTLRHWLPVRANRNQAFKIRHEGTHHEKFAQSSRMSYIPICIQVALATSDVESILDIYRQLMTSTWRIETKVLPEPFKCHCDEISRIHCFCIF